MLKYPKLAYQLIKDCSNHDPIVIFAEIRSIMHSILRTGVHQLLLLFVFIAFSRGADAQVKVDTVVHWKSVKEVMELQKKAPRPVLVFFYQPGHDTSQLMLEITFTRKELCSYINPNFYAIRIAASDTAIDWLNGKRYLRKKGQEMNELVAHVLGEKAVLPSMVFFNDENTGIVMSGFRSRYEMRCLLMYFGEGVERTTPYHLWYNAYQLAYPQINLPKATKNPVHWISLEEALEKQKKEPRMLYINWYARLNAGSMVMLYNAYENPKVAEYLNKNFYCVRLDAQSKDTLVWNKPFYNEKKEDKYHELARLQLGNSFKFPSHLFYDKQMKLIYKQQSYLGPLNFYALINFLGSGSYTSKTFKDYIKTFKGKID